MVKDCKIGLTSEDGKLAIATVQNNEWLDTTMVIFNDSWENCAIYINVSNEEFAVLTAQLDD